MFTRTHTTDRNDNSAVMHAGDIAMLNANMNASSNNRIKTLAATIAITAVALFSTTAPASADGGFTPDGVNFIPVPGGVPSYGIPLHPVVCTAYLRRTPIRDLNPERVGASSRCTHPTYHFVGTFAGRKSVRRNTSSGVVNTVTYSFICPNVLSA